MASVKNLHKSGLGSCAIAEISGVQGYDPKQIVMDAAKYFFETVRCGAFIYSVSNSNPSGDAIMEFITKNELGKVTKIEPFVNYRYNEAGGSTITMYCWAVDFAKFKAFWEGNKPAVAETIVAQQL